MHSVTLNWTASVDTVDGYNLYRGTVKGQETTKLNSSLVVGTSFVDSNPIVGDTFYVAKSFANGVESVASNEVSVVLLPSAPSNLVASAS